jgi:hypothetical protein
MDSAGSRSHAPWSAAIRYGSLDGNAARAPTFTAAADNRAQVVTPRLRRGMMRVLS